MNGEGSSQGKSWRKLIPGTGKSRYKGPEVRISMPGQKKKKKERERMQWRLKQ